MKKRFCAANTKPTKLLKITLKYRSRICDEKRCNKVHVTRTNTYYSSPLIRNRRDFFLRCESRLCVGGVYLRFTIASKYRCDVAKRTFARALNANERFVDGSQESSAVPRHVRQTILPTLRPLCMCWCASATSLTSYSVIGGHSSSLLSNHSQI